MTLKLNSLVWTTTMLLLKFHILNYLGTFSVTNEHIFIPTRQTTELTISCVSFTKWLSSEKKTGLRTSILLPEGTFEINAIEELIRQQLNTKSENIFPLKHNNNTLHLVIYSQQYSNNLQPKNSKCDFYHNYWSLAINTSPILRSK